MDIFPNAATARNSGLTYTRVHNEIRAIETAILTAIDAGIYTAVISNSTMTDTTLSAFQTITNVNTSTYVLTKTAHGLTNGDEVQFQSTVTLPSPLTSSATYYVTVIDANTFKVSSSYINYVNGVILPITTAGSGTITFREISLAQSFFKVWQGNKEDRGQLLQMTKVIEYFTLLGYDIVRQTNTASNVTFSWILRW